MAIRLFADDEKFAAEALPFDESLCYDAVPDDSAEALPFDESLCDDAVPDDSVPTVAKPARASGTGTARAPSTKHFNLKPLAINPLAIDPLATTMGLDSSRLVSQLVAFCN